MMNDDLPLVSIVVPAFNVAQYIEQCLESILLQVYSNIECIVVDDGSTDRTGVIAKKYCASHEKFCYVYQKNQGSGIARNVGVQKSKGKFVMFIDPDDWIEKGYVESFVRVQEENNYDLVVSGLTELYYRNNQMYRKRVRQSKYQESLNQVKTRQLYLSLLNCGLLSGPVCKLYKLSVIKEKNIVFPDYRRSQDIVFNYRYYNAIKTIKVIENYTYNYRRIYANSPKKIYQEYITIIRKIYLDIKQLCQDWKLNVSDENLANFSIIYVYGYMLSCVANKIKFEKYIYDDVINEIIKFSCPQRRTVAIFKKLIEKKYIKVLEIYLSVVCIIKKYCR